MVGTRRMQRRRVAASASGPTKASRSYTPPPMAAWTGPAAPTARLLVVEGPRCGQERAFGRRRRDARQRRRLHAPASRPGWSRGRASCADLAARGALHAAPSGGRPLFDGGWREDGELGCAGERRRDHHRFAPIALRVDGEERRIASPRRASRRWQRAVTGRLTVRGRVADSQDRMNAFGVGLSVALGAGIGARLAVPGVYPGRSPDGHALVGHDLRVHFPSLPVGAARRPPAVRPPLGYGSPGDTQHRHRISPRPSARAGCAWRRRGAKNSSVPHSALSACSFRFDH